MFYYLLTICGIITLTNGEVFIYKENVDMYYKFHRTPETWYRARIMCTNENATLAMPKNEAEAQALKEIFDTYPKSMLRDVQLADYIFLGFHDRFKEGEYVTLNGETIQYYYHTWVQGQPDNFNNEDCGSLHRSGKLNDNPCNTPGVFICQRKGEKIHSNPDNNCFTMDPAYEYAQRIEKCYKFHLDPRPWPEARAICHAEGGYLAIIRNKEEEAYLEKMFNKPANRVPFAPNKDYALVGFHDIFKEGYYTTVLDEEMHDIGYVNWNSGQPDNYGFGENCGSITKSGRLNDFACDAPALFFCEQPASNAIDARFGVET